MKRFRFILTILLALLIGYAAAQMQPASTHAASIATFKTALISAVQANFPAGQQTTVANSFVSAYQGEWNARLADGTYTDTPANRGQFAADKIIAYVQEVVRSEQYKASIQAVASP